MKFFIIDKTNNRTELIMRLSSKWETTQNVMKLKLGQKFNRNKTQIGTRPSIDTIVTTEFVTKLNILQLKILQLKF